jgi:uncharacterized protein (DUF1501 family)
MKRRNFLKTSATAAITIGATQTMFGSLYQNALISAPTMQQLAALTQGTDKIVVLIQLQGGNDGLNTLIPIETSAYYDARPTINIPKSETLALTSTLGWHPKMAGMKQLYDEGKLAIVQGVSYENSDRSHFRGTDIWLTATDSDVIKNTGWVGRYLQTLAPEFPITLPDEPLAVQLGTTLSMGLNSDGGSIGITFRTPEEFYNLVRGTGSSIEDESIPDTAAGNELEFMRTISRAAQSYSQIVKDKGEVGKNYVTYANNDLANKLKVVAQLIDGGLNTKVYLVAIEKNSFDTHINQGGTTGDHASLLEQVSTSVKSFMDDIAASGNADRVVGFTFSEFGRRVRENGSAGTDHGSAAPMFVFGNKVLGGKIIGNDPDFVNVDPYGDILMQYDYRQVYSSVLGQWFGSTDTAIQSLLFNKSFEQLPLFEQDISSVKEADFQLEASVFPNPAQNNITVKVSFPQATRAMFTLYSLQGKAVSTPVAADLPSGMQQFSMNIPSLPTGAYYLEVQAGSFKKGTLVEISGR